VNSAQERLALLDARDAGLTHASDDALGFRRVRRGRGFTYVRRGGGPVTDARVLARIRALAVPPAWTDVWINADPRGHLQATGRDARGRKQSRYHARWRAVRDEAKFDRMIAFGRALPRIRRQVARDLAASRLTLSCVVATIVRLLDTTLVRVGNDEYARANHSYGLTTLRDVHVSGGGGRAVLRFPGKGGKAHEVTLSDRRAARIVRRCRRLPGRRLFQFLDRDGRRHAVGSEDVNAYLRWASRDEFTAKDFRTWRGTVLALTHLRGATHLLGADGPRGSATRQRAVNAAIDAVAERLRNTRAVCRSSYIHPAVLRAYEDRSLLRVLARCAETGRCPRGLDADEAATFRFLVHQHVGPRAGSAKRANAVA
jgi:DNA topoisomerase I